MDADRHDTAFLRIKTNLTSFRPLEFNNLVAKLLVILDASNAILAITRNFPYLPTFTFRISPEEVACEFYEGQTRVHREKVILHSARQAHHQVSRRVEMKSILITGCNRGLGLGLVKQLVQRPTPPKHLIATCRNPQQAEVRLTCR